MNIVRLAIDLFINLDTVSCVQFFEWGCARVSFGDESIDLNPTQASILRDHLNARDQTARPQRELYGLFAFWQLAQYISSWSERFGSDVEAKAESLLNSSTADERAQFAEMIIQQFDFDGKALQLARLVFDFNF